MKTATIKLFQASELKPNAREKAREWYREAFSFEAESTLEDAKEIASLLGFDVEEIYYSGFYNQGDGACFVGSWTAEKALDCVAQVKAHAPQDEKLHDIAATLERIAKVFTHGTAKIWRSHTSHYYHEHSITIDLDAEDTTDTFFEEEGGCFGDTVRAFCLWIYRQLERESEYQGSNEYVDEGLAANEWTFLEDGKRFEADLEPEVTPLDNETRAARGRQALQGYADRSEWQNNQENLIDLLADLRLAFADDPEVDFAAAVNTSLRHFHAEKD